jgi:hypothetical protein
MIKMTDREFTIWGLEQWEKLMKNRTDKDTEQEPEHIPTRMRYAWVHSDPKDPTRWPGLREQLRGIESFLYRDVIRWKYRQKLLLYAEEMGLICNEIEPIDGIEAWGAIGGERWMIIPKEELEDSEKETIEEFLKVEE